MIRRAIIAALVAAFIGAGCGESVERITEKDTRQRLYQEAEAATDKQHDRR